MAEFSEAALKAEIDNDPAGLGYPLLSSDQDQQIADLINAKTLVIDRLRVSSEDVNGDTHFAWYDGMLIDKQEFYTLQTRRDSWKVTEDMKMFLTGRALTMDGAAGVGADSQSEWAAADRGAAAPAMLALIEIPGSRAEVLWDEGRSISVNQVGRVANV